MTDKEAMKLALDALIWTTGSGDFSEGGQAHDGAKKCLFPAITALKKQLADHAMREVQRLGQEIEQEPVAHCKVRPLRGDESFPKVEIDWVNHPIPGPLYTSPPQRTEQEPDDMASILACRDMLDAQPVPPRTWVGLTDEDMYVVSEEESCSFIAGAKWSEAILKEKNT